MRRDGSRAELMGCISILDHQETLQEFKTKLSHLRRLYETLMPDPVVFEKIRDYEWVISINISLQQVRHQGRARPEFLRGQDEGAHNGEAHREGTDSKIKTFSIDRDYLGKLERERFSEDEKVAELKRALQHQISINSGDPAYEGLGERLQKVLKTHEKRRAAQGTREPRRGDGPYPSGSPEAWSDEGGVCHPQRPEEVRGP